MSNENEIGLTVNAGPVQQGVDKSIAALDKLISFLGKFEAAIAKTKKGGTTALEGTLADQAKFNKSYISQLEELRTKQLLALQNGNIGTVDYTKQQNKILQGLYDGRKAIVGKFTEEELRIWKKLRVDLGKIENAQLDEIKTAAAAEMKRLRSLGAEAAFQVSEQMRFRQEAARLDKSEAQAEMQRIKELGNVWKAMYAQRVKDDKAATAASAANIKQLGGVWQAMQAHNKTAAKELEQAEKAEQAALRAKGKAITTMVSEQIRIRVNGEAEAARAAKEAAEVQLANIKRIGNAWKAVHSQNTAAAKAAMDAAAAAAKAQVPRATSSAAGAYSSLRTGSIVDPLSAAAAAQVAAATASTTAMYSNLQSGKLVNAPELERGAKAMRKLGDDMGYAHSMARGLASGFNLLWLTWGKLAPLFAGASISFGIAKTFSIGSEVEYLIRFMTTLGDLTKEQGAQIRDELRKIDQTTLFSLTELSKTMVELGQAGLTAKESLKVTKSAADLAAVGMTDLTTSSTLLVKTMALFPEAAGDVDKIAAQIFETTKAGLLTVGDIGESMKYASTAGILYGQTLEGTLTVLKSLAQAGIKGTAAGTAYSNMLQDLGGRSKPAIAALKEIEARTGKTISTFDAMGKARPAFDVINDIGNALKQFRTDDALKLLNQLFTERGIKAYAASVRDGTDALTEFADKLKDTDKTAFFMAAKGMMDTTKGAFDILKGSLVGALDRVFESMGDRFKSAIVGITKAIDSDEFFNTVKGMVGGVITLYEWIVKLSPALLGLAAAFAAFKGASLLAASMGSLLGLLAPLTGAMGMTAYAMGNTAGKATAAALSVTGLGTTMVVTAAQTHAARIGMDAAGVAAAGAAMKMQAATGVTRALAVAVGFLANPIVGIVTTLGILGATWWSVSRESQAASGSLTDKVYKDGKLSISILDQEIAKLHQRNALRDRPSNEVTELADGARLKRDQLHIKYLEERARLEKLANAPVSLGNESALKMQQTYVNTLKAQREQAQKDVVKLDESAATYSAKVASDEMARNKKTQDAIKKATDAAADAAARQDNPGRVIEDLGGAAKATDVYTTSVQNNAAAIDKQTNAELAAAKVRFDYATKVADAQHEAQLMSAGAYHAQMIMLTEEYEAKQRAAHEVGNSRLVEDYARVTQELAAEAAKDIEKNNGTANYKLERQQALNTALVAEAQKFAGSVATNATQIETIEKASQLRRETEHLAHIKKIKEAEKQAADYLKNLKSEQDSARAQDEFNAKYAGVNENSSASAKAMKAAALATLEVTKKHKAEIDRLSEALKKATLSYSDMLAQAGRADNSPEQQLALTVAAERYKEEMTTAEKALLDLKIAAGEDAAIAAARAYKSEMQKAQEELSSALTDSIVTALLEGGEAGKKKFRDIFVKELEKQLTVNVNALVNWAMGGQTSGMGGGGNDIVGWATKAYDWYTGGSSAAAAATAASYKSYAASGGSYAASSVGDAAVVSTGSTAATTSSTSAAMGYMGYAALIAAAVMVAESLYKKGYSRAAVGHGEAEWGQVGQYSSYTSDPNMGNSTAYNIGIENFTRGIYDWIGMSEKWADIFSGTVRFAHMFGRKLSGYGMEADITGGDVSVSGYADYKGGLFRSDKSVAIELDSRDAANLQAQVSSVMEGTKSMAAAMGLSSEAIDAYTGSIKVNYKGADTAEEQAKRLSDAMADLQYSMLKAASGGELTRDSFDKMVDQANAAADSVGINAESISNVLINGMMQGLGGAQTGAQLADVIAGGIINALAQNYTAQVANMFMNQIVTPVFTAIMAGVPISQAISSASIESMVAYAQEAAAALNAVLNDPAIRDAINQIGAAAAEVGASFGGISLPDFGGMASYSAAAAAADEAAQALAEIEQERYDLENQMLDLLGRTTELRARELEEIDASNQALQMQIWLVEDTAAALDSALETYRRSMEAEMEAVDQRIEDTTDARDKLKDIFDTLGDAIKDLQTEVTDALEMQADAARAMIRQTISTGVMPDVEDLADWIDSAINGLESTRFGSATARDRATLQLAGELQALQDIASPQLDTAEQMLVALEAERITLDEHLALAEEQYNALLGIDDSVMLVSDALWYLNSAMATYTSVIADANASVLDYMVAAPAAPTTSSGSSGSYSGGSSSGSSSSSAWNAEGYWSKNADLRTEYERLIQLDPNQTDPKFNKDPALSYRDEYLKWHWETLGKTEGRKFARGGAFTNGVVTRPTEFNMGTMGEAGSEGILPLANVGGSLGVHAVTSSDDETKSLLLELLYEIRAARAEGVATARNTSRVANVLEKVSQNGNSVAVHTLTARPLATKETA